MELVLGIDLGTSYFKLGVFNHEGKLRGLGRAAVQTNAGDGTLCELPIDDFWAALRTALNEALRQADARADDIRAVSYSSQANSFLVLGQGDVAMTPLILWPDRRVTELDSSVARLFDRADFTDTTGLGIGGGPGFAIAKIKWLQENRPELWAGVQRIMTISDFLVYSLTGRAVGDAATASLLGIFDVRKMRWWEEVLPMIGLSRPQLSVPLRAGSAIGGVSGCGSDLLGLARGIPVVAGSLDHHMAAIGAGLGSIEQLSESTGTVLACLGYTNRFTPIESGCIGPGLEENTFYKLAFSGNGASVLEWYQRTYAPQLSVGELVSLAGHVPPGCDGLVALESADKYPDLEGFTNVTSAHSPGHFARSIMESVAATLAAHVGMLCPNGFPKRILATGGGAESDLWLQMKADLIGVEFLRPSCLEPACKGAALFASVGAGWFTDLDQAGQAWKELDVVFKSARSGHTVKVKRS